MSHEDYINKRNNALFTLHSKAFLDGAMPNMQYIKGVAQYIEEAAKAIDALVLEVIGEDNDTINQETVAQGVGWKNQLMSDQRSIVRGGE